MTIGRLPKLVAAGLGARAAVTLRRMVRVAKRDADPGGLRPRALRAGDRLLTAAGRLALPFRPIFRLLARRTERDDSEAS